METKKSKNVDLEKKRPLLLSISLVLALSFVLLAFSWKTPVDKITELQTIQWEIPEDIFIPSTEEEVKEIAPPIKTVIQFELVKDETEIDDSKLEIFDTEVADEGIDVENLINMREEEKTDEMEKVFLYVDEMPEFPGGMASLLRFISNAVNYPIIAQENGIQGKVFVSFIINIDGHVSHAEVIRGVDQSLDREALRVINRLPRWIPGKQSGRAVRVSFNVPINFVLQ